MAVLFQLCPGSDSEGTGIKGSRLLLVSVRKRSCTDCHWKERGTGLFGVARMIEFQAGANKWTGKQLPYEPKLNTEIRIFESSDEIVTDLAEYISQVSEISIKESGYFAIVMSGAPLVSFLGLMIFFLFFASYLPYLFLHANLIQCALLHLKYPVFNF